MSGLAVFKPRRFVRLLLSDAMNIARDPMLLFAIVLSIAPSAAFWLTQPALDEAALAAFGVERFSRYLVPLVLLIPAYLIGWVTGFLLLEDRDDGPLLALDVTPVGKAGFLAYRVAVTALVTAIITLGALQVITPDPGPLPAFVILLLVPANAVLAALVLPAIARNKVEGLALTKLINLASVLPLLAIVPSPWRYLAGIVPTYWIGELLSLSGTDYLPLGVVIALAVVGHIAAGGLLFRLLSRRVG